MLGIEKWAGSGSPLTPGPLSKGRGVEESTSTPQLDQATARSTSDVLLPPKPNELETATDTGWLIA